MGEGSFIPPHGGYRKLRSFQVAQDIYNATVIFCERFVDKKLRTYDQMIQAARSGMQNIAEGSMASATSKKMEIKLTGIAKASLEELLNDYENHLRHRGLNKWDKDSEKAKSVRMKYLSDKSDLSDESDPYGIRTATEEDAANIIICLIHQATYLLRRQLERLEKDFLERGGITERMFWARRHWRDKQPKSEEKE